MRKLIAFYSVLLLLFFLNPILLSARTTLNVADQSSFDLLQRNLTNAIKTGEKEIVVNISSGYYIAKENHINLNEIKAPDVSIRIIGKAAIVLPDGKIFSNGDLFKGELSYNNSWMDNSQDIKIWSDVRYADGLVEILDETEKRCRLKSKESLVSIVNGASYILIPHWFQSSIYKIDRISGNYIYFTATDLKKSFEKGYNVNGDYHYGKKDIRFKLLNAKGERDCLRIIDGKVFLPTGVTAVREGTVNRLITIHNCSFNSIEISGIKFWGNSYVRNSSAIYLNKNKTNTISIHNCEFRGMRGNVITITASPNVCIQNNLFADCYYYGITSNNNSRNTTVKDNTFINIGKRMQNTFCIVCRGPNFLISNNRLMDFGYGGIGIGVHYKNSDNNPCSGVAENNELSYTDGYIAKITNYGIMDSGAIYLTTKHSGTIIRNNYIHNYSGIKDNRGIFCDDGAFNLQIYENVIIGITNSYCIDSRRVASVDKSKTPEYGIERANVNIVIRDNILDGRIRFVAHEDKNNGCVKGHNFVLKKTNGSFPQNTLKNLSKAEEDVVLECIDSSKGKIRLSSKSFKQLKKTKIWPFVRNYVVK